MPILLRRHWNGIHGRFSRTHLDGMRDLRQVVMLVNLFETGACGPYIP